MAIWHPIKQEVVLPLGHWDAKKRKYRRDRVVVGTGRKSEWWFQLFFIFDP